MKTQPKDFKYKNYLLLSKLFHTLTILTDKNWYRLV